MIQKILDKNQKKRIDRILETGDIDINELSNPESLWHEIKKIRRKMARDKLINRSKNMYLDGIYYCLVLKFIDQLVPELTEIDPSLNFLRRNVISCLKKILRCYNDLFGFLLRNPNMITSICRSKFFFEKKTYSIGLTTGYFEPIYGFITFLCKNSQHENSIIAINEANYFRCEFIRIYKFNDDAGYIDNCKNYLEPNYDQSAQLMIYTLEGDSELCDTKKQLRGAVVVAVVSTIVFLIFLILGIVFASELMYLMSIILFLICFLCITLLISLIRDDLEGIQALKSNFDNNLNLQREKLKQLNHDKIKYKKRFKQDAEFLLNSNERFLSERNNFYKPRFFEDQEYINSKQENDLLEYVAK